MQGSIPGQQPVSFYPAGKVSLPRDTLHRIASCLSIRYVDIEHSTGLRIGGDAVTISCGIFQARSQELQDQRQSAGNALGLVPGACVWLLSLCCTLGWLSFAWGMPVRHAAPAQLMAEGLRAFQRGEIEQAAVHWREAARLYASTSQVQAHSAALTHLASAYKALGTLGDTAEAERLLSDTLAHTIALNNAS